jgi:hypothetical protein
MIINVTRLPNQLRIGWQGENDARPILFDWSQWAATYGEGVLTILLQRNGDTAPYPVVTESDGTTTTWNPSVTDTSVPGVGRLQIRYTVGDVIAKSAVITVRIEQSLTAETDPPDPYDSWVETLTALGAETEANAQEAQAAQTAAEAAQAGAEAALAEFVGVTAEAETLPAGSDATASYSDGHLTFGIPTGATGAQGPQGPQGERGDTGPAGPTGADGFSPTATVTESDGDITITITDKSGTTSATLRTDSEMDADSTNPVQNRAIVEALREMLPTDTASGAIASFPDGADNVPVKSLSVSIEPVQDLHGQSAPYPAGGGKQLLNPTTFNGLPASHNGVTATLNDNGTISLSGTATANAYLTVIDYRVLSDFGIFTANTSYTLSMYINSGVYGILGIYGSGTDYRDYTGSGSQFSFTAEQLSTLRYRLVIYVANGTNTNGMVIKPMICLSSASNPTVFAPYENICPIAGHTSATVTRTGRNLIKPSYTGRTHNGVVFTVNNDGTITANGTASGDAYSTARIDDQNLLTFVPAGTYMISGGKSNDKFVYMAGTYVDGTSIPGRHSKGSAVSLTLTKDAYIYPQVCITSGQTCTNEVFTIQLEPGSTASSYEPYQAQSITIQLGQTIYGGTLDVVGGKMVVDRAMATLTGSETWYEYTSFQGFYTLLHEMRNGTRHDGISNMLVAVKTSEYGQKNTMWLGVNNKYFFAIGVYETMGSTLADFKSYLATNNLQVVYPLATPITIDLTPQQMTTLLGTNNVWSDAGDVEVTYKADVQRYIQKMIAEAVS